MRHAAGPEPDCRRTPPVTELLIARDVAVTARGVPLVQPVSLSLRAGQVLTILGETGSGKSLLAQAIIIGPARGPGRAGRRHAGGAGLGPVAPGRPPRALGAGAGRSAAGAVAGAGPLDACPRAGGGGSRAGPRPALGRGPRRRRSRPGRSGAGGCGRPPARPAVGRHGAARGLRRRAHRRRPHRHRGRADQGSGHRAARRGDRPSGPRGPGGRRAADHHP
ncbi:ATP-binding cassette domain-containing protein (plasmid) [Paracoccus aestuarii]|nr:ATP-binding cassette domain-containing protein [Paracoccus aestuarii]